MRTRIIKHTKHNTRTYYTIQIRKFLIWRPVINMWNEEWYSYDIEDARRKVAELEARDKYKEKKEVVE